MSLTDEWASTPLEGVVHDDTERSMDPAVRDLFVAALRSGMYTQGFDRLRTEDTFTPLGVLCDLAVRVGVCAWDKVDGEYFIAPMDPPATGGHLPPIVREWAKIKGTHPSQELPLMYREALHPIWRVSDIFRAPLGEVANLIATQY